MHRQRGGGAELEHTFAVLTVLDHELRTGGINLPFLAVDR